MKRKKSNRTVSILGGLVFLFAFVVNVSVFSKTSSSQGNKNLLSLVSQASAEDESGDGESGGGTYKWSEYIDCHGSFTGSYKVCNVNGSGTTCSSNGAVSCSCSGGTCGWWPWP